MDENLKNTLDEKINGGLDLLTIESYKDPTTKDVIRGVSDLSQIKRDVDLTSIEYQRLNNEAKKLDLSSEQLKQDYSKIELDRFRLQFDIEKEKISSENANLRLNLDTTEVSNNYEINTRKLELEEEKNAIEQERINLEKELLKYNYYKTDKESSDSKLKIISELGKSAITGLGMIACAGLWCAFYHVELDKMYKFEETGMISSSAGRGLTGGFFKRMK